MVLSDSNFSFLESDQASLINFLWERLAPSRWPFRLEDLPIGSALVGGSIRDALLNRLQHNPDLDFVVPSSAINLVKDLSNKTGGTPVILDLQRDIARLVLNGFTVDFATQVGNSLQEDLSRRDFTINSIALLLAPVQEILDPHGGINHLKQKKLIEVHKNNLLEDPLRLLRGFRLSSELNLALDSKTIEFISFHVENLKSVAVERIKVEIERLVAGLWADEVIPIIQQIGLLESWKPRTNNSNTNALSLTNISSLNANEQEIAVPLIRLTNLLSDKGLEDLGFHSRKRKDCYLLRFWHNKCQELSYQSLSEEKRITLHKDLEKIMPAFIIQLSENTQKNWLSRWRDLSDPLFHPRSPLDGYTLKEIFNVPQGPWIGQLMNFLCQEKAFGRVQNRHDALESAFVWWKHNQPFCD